MKYWFLLVFLLTLCATPTASLAAEARKTYSVELVVESANGFTMRGKARCARNAVCNIPLFGSFAAAIAHDDYQYRLSIYGTSPSSTFGGYDCCGVSCSTCRMVEIPTDRRSVHGYLYYGPEDNDLVFRMSRKFGIFSVVFNK